MKCQVRESWVVEGSEQDRGMNIESRQIVVSTVSPGVGTRLGKAVLGGGSR